MNECDIKGKKNHKLESKPISSSFFIVFINNTLVYTQLVDFGDDEYTVRVAHTIEEDKQLIEAGFEYVTERDGYKIYRKRK